MGAKIYQAQPIDLLVKGLKLEIGRERIPNEIADKIVPVFNISTPLPRLREFKNVIANSSSKILTIPSGKTWEILWCYASLTTSATVGTRQIGIRIRDINGTAVWDTRALNTQAASSTERYHFQKGIQTSDETLSGQHIIPLPKDLFLNSSFEIVIEDVNAVDATADDMEVFIIFNEYDFVPASA